MLLSLRWILIFLLWLFFLALPITQSVIEQFYPQNNTICMQVTSQSYVNVKGCIPFQKKKKNTDMCIMWWLKRPTNRPLTVKMGPKHYKPAFFRPFSLQSPFIRPTSISIFWKIAVQVGLHLTYILSIVNVIPVTALCGWIPRHEKSPCKHTIYQRQMTFSSLIWKCFNNCTSVLFLSTDISSVWCWNCYLSTWMHVLPVYDRVTTFEFWQFLTVMKANCRPTSNSKGT